MLFKKKKFLWPNLECLNETITGVVKLPLKGYFAHNYQHTSLEVIAVWSQSSYCTVEYQLAETEKYSIKIYHHLCYLGTNPFLKPLALSCRLHSTKISKISRGYQTRCVPRSYTPRLQLIFIGKKRINQFCKDLSPGEHPLCFVSPPALPTPILYHAVW